MKKVSRRQEEFPGHRISLTKTRNLSDPRDMKKVKLAEILKSQLSSRNQSVHALAEATGIPSSTLHSWVAEGQLPSAKNLHYVHALSQYLGISLSVLLFGVREDESGSSILFQSQFRDGDHQYKLIIEKIISKKGES